MRTSRFVLLGAVICAILVPTNMASATTPQVVPVTPEITIQSQPFNIFSAVNAKFVITPRLAAVATGNDRLEFLIHRQISFADSFRSIANEEVQSAVTDSISLRLSNVTRDLKGQLTATVPINITKDKQNALFIPRNGVYPLTIRIVESKTNVVLGSVITFLNRQDMKAETPKIPFSNIVRLAPEPSFAPDGSLVITDSTRASVRELVAFLGSFTLPVTISLQPEVIAALAESPDSVDAELLLSLQNQMQTRSVMNATFMPLSPMMLEGAGLYSEFKTQLKLGEDTLARLLPGVIIHRNTWLATDSLSPEAVAMMIDAGITSLVLAPSAQTNVDREQPPSLLGRVAGTGETKMSVVSAYAPFESTLRERSVGSVRDGYAVAAELLMERQDLLATGNGVPDIRMALMSTFDGSAESSAITFAVRALTQVQELEFVDYGISTAAQDTTPAVSFTPSSLVFGSGRAAALTTVRQKLNAVVSMLGPDDVHRRLWEYQLGIGTSGSAASGAEYIGTLSDQLQATTSAITVTTPDHVTLSSRTGSIRVQVRNESPTDLTVQVRLLSAKLKVSKPRHLVTLSAGTTTEVAFSATTKTNGNFPLTIAITTPEGAQAVIPRITITARVTAVAGLGQLISISLLLVLLAWWWSNRRSARRESSSTTTV